MRACKLWKIGKERLSQKAWHGVGGAEKRLAPALWYIDGLRSSYSDAKHQEMIDKYRVFITILTRLSDFWVDF